jgi:hypothetical protein
MDTVNVLDLRAGLSAGGVVFVTGALGREMTEKLKNRIVNVYNSMFQGENDMQVKSSKDLGKSLEMIARNSFDHGTSKMAAKSTGMMNRQPLTGDWSVHQAKLTFRDPRRNTREEEVMQFNPVYGDVNQWLLMQPEAQKMFDTITTLSGNSISMLSPDSMKVAYSHKLDAHPFTPAHLDHYYNLNDRIQIVLNVHEDRTKLFYCPGATDPVVRGVLAQLQPGFYDKQGFRKIDPKQKDLLTVLRRFMVAPPPGSLTFWRSGVVHGEYTSTATPGARGLYQATDEDQKREQLAIRLYIGTHIPIDLSLTDLMKLALANRSYGMIPSRYTHNKQQFALSKYNKVNKGTTRWGKVTLNKDLLKDKQSRMYALDRVSPREMMAEYFKKLPPKFGALTGIPLDEDRAFPTEEEVDRHRKIVGEHRVMLQLLAMSDEELLQATGAGTGKYPVETDIQFLISHTNMPVIHDLHHLSAFIEQFIPVGMDQVERRMQRISERYNDLTYGQKDEWERLRRLHVYISTLEKRLRELLLVVVEPEKKRRKIVSPEHVEHVDL